jgi:hypothetical protein
MSVSDREADENVVFTGEMPSIKTNDLIVRSQLDSTIGDN